MGTVFERLKNLLQDLKPSETLEEDLSLPMAAAMLLFEVAWSDQDIAAEEVDSIRASLRVLFSLPESEVDRLVEEARSRIQDSTSVFPFTHTLNEHLSFEEKRHLVFTLWQLALADHTIEALEEHTIRRIADLLYVPHSSFISAKIKAKREKT